MVKIDIQKLYNFPPVQYNGSELQYNSINRFKKSTFLFFLRAYIKRNKHTQGK